MHIIEIYARNPEELHRATSFLHANHIAYTKKGSVSFNEEQFYKTFALDKHTFIKPSREFASLCGKEHLNKRGEIQLNHVFSFLCDQLQNPNCFFLESLMETQEYLAAV